MPDNAFEELVKRISHLSYMSERERTILCRANKEVSFSWDGHNLFTVMRDDSDFGILTQSNLYPRVSISRFGCIDCPLVFNKCEISLGTVSVSEVADLLRKNTTTDTLKQMREKVFASLDLEPYFPPPGELFKS